MNYLSVENISKSYGERTLFSELSFGIDQGEKIAFVARNGTGKTSLLNIITGNDTPDNGKVITRNNLRIGYLSQKDNLKDGLTIEEAVFSSGNRILKIIRQYEKALENPEDTAIYQQAFERMEQHRAWDFETRYKQILSKLKLENLDQKISELSGGQRKRLSLAMVLLSDPDLFVMDEPTNHLDIEMIEWLEAYFATEKETLFMVTHDRYFLDRVCNKIIELDEGKLYTYQGNYSYFLEQKEQRTAQEQAELARAKNRFRSELEWMRRQPKARTTKSKARIDDFQDIKARAAERRKEHEIELEINMERLGSKIVELHNVSKSYNEIKVLDSFDYVFKRGERIGIIGKNGTGKSTFLNIITGKTTVDTGKVVVGETVKFGYYTQKGIQVKPKAKVIDVIKDYGEYIPLTKGRKISAGNLLERFLFNRKQQFDYVEKLSGGELKRLYLCTVLIQNPNFILLDEPTNDLDILTLNVLEGFLLDFPGNLLVVSHDRYFMDKIVDHLFVFKDDGLVQDFPGNYSDYRTYEDERPKEPIGETPKTQETANEKSQKPKLSYLEKKEFGQLEKDIERLEAKKSAIEQQFAENTIDMEEIDKVSIKLQEIKNSIAEKEERWLEISMKMDEINEGK